MENLVNRAFWQGRRVLVTGHTGFKGSWLSLWLQSMGANVIGYALKPPNSHNLFEVANVAQGMQSIIGDIRDLDSIRSAVAATQPEIVFHLAAQALVAEGYRDPVNTYATNVQGTVHLLESVRANSGVQVVVVVTSDKCYENNEWMWPYRENEPLGGHDPYSSSKACTEIVTSAYNTAFLRDAKTSVATARAGNVIGGGDWSPNRLIPDLLAAFSENRSAELRRPHSIRPWQHVLDALAGYLILAEQIANEPSLAGPWNFGPEQGDCLPASEIAHRITKTWGEEACWHTTATTYPHEAGTLRLDSSKAKYTLGWRPTWAIDDTLKATVDWHKAWLESKDMKSYTLGQIKKFNTTTGTIG